MAALDQYILTLATNGYGKRTSAYEYAVRNRGGQGIANIDLATAKNNAVVASFTVEVGDQLVLVTDNGQMIRTTVDDIRITGRSTRGVIVFRVAEDEQVVSVSWLRDDEEEEESEASEGSRAEASAANVMPVRDQIVAAVAARPGENRIEVRLDPPELGKVTIAFEGDGPDIIRAVVYADTSQTLDLMRRHADVFQRALGEQGFENLDLQFAERGPRDNASDEAKEQLRSFRLADDEGPAPETPGPLQYVEGRLDRRM